MSGPIAGRVRAIRYLVLDVDGVLTDGSVNYGDPVQEIRRFHVRDGAALRWWHDLGYSSVIISGRQSESLLRRAKELGVPHVFQGVKDKAPVLQSFQQTHGWAREACLMIGDDLAELSLFPLAGVRVAVADAAWDLRRVADYVTRWPGGQGALRETLEWVWKAKGEWGRVLARFPMTV